LLLAADGNFYGVTNNGGDANCNCGTVFRVTPSGLLTTLHAFTGGATDGSNPYWASLTQGSDGTIYGTTEEGGPDTSQCPLSMGCGTVFQISPAGVESLVYAFPKYGDACNPQGNVIPTGGSGSPIVLYGAAVGYNSSHPVGSVYKLTL
jgi:uncharacterized repeat protein (TIGR03803 family)